jgi:hypothetical protein
MKYFKTYEEQLNLFQEYDDSMPDSLDKISDDYVGNIEKSEHIDKDSDINSWEDAYWYFKDTDNVRKVVEYMIESGHSLEEDELEYHFSSDFSRIKPHIISFLNIDTDTNDEKYKEALDAEILDDFLEIYEIDYLELFKYLLDTVGDSPLDYIDTTHYEILLKWIRNSNHHNVYRAMTISHKVKDINRLEYDNVGVFWTHNEGEEESYWSDGGLNEIILKANIEPEDVNWEQTLYKSLYSLNYEQEIELIKDTTIDLLSIEFNSNHPIIRKRDEQEHEYFSKIGLKDAFKYKSYKKKHGSLYWEFDEPIIVKT